ncbi:MAG: hypothetical protein A3I88_00980 [Candidatus Portnoybacteria bacterium RIFCSPLOWO2_12_FULL_39_9]|nr:MAG: hypothetical protein A2646_02200 [Candidatus Portnoybacteria bacterium RIFCSPHIGHO2_02_FULL_39_12]OGZ37744.1 MAG: hypothetical protein A3F21_01935 [Candidatus Portnoybacteria bacterium RIFCSPLOWO2_01_FULL_38_39]OGZ40383.1 MAG: hypothetical protein A3I88_00980 [Candidatus Portnoybacteria bacterium RIFCSPLOWO2_12_FULL_39_9]
MAYQKFRVRSPVKSFRDLEVYQEATKLSAEIFGLKPPKKYQDDNDVKSELNILKEMSKITPKLIVESYGDKFTDFDLADRKLEKSAYTINMIMAKLDFLNALVNSEEFREQNSAILKRYQRTKWRIINLKRAWAKVFKR